MSRTARPAAYTAIQAAVGRRMRLVRELLRESQSDAAKLIGTDQSTLNKIELGTRAPSIFNIIAFATRFRVSTDYLLRGHLIEMTDEELKLHLARFQSEEQLPPLARKDEGTDKDPEVGKLIQTTIRAAAQ